mmetsp:Transcript_2446/g.3472  ORF Transcript_2446/g.3472 Transcript_2446/m.3472 type:complete len:214 (+) Transcript_2446:86-727(+)|eukprot:CAMPEP_0117794326 /NCGR_PEP_ID=MMETSP0948-20121206/10619_1 /TAXON_ID=44440 /ORGANISM="Chattonella subsalsa, Strain CCMP2191" /LENGTH=213 /DNA_ID=CAMNT_0005625015 /DNA_START=65 /DNA_END=706 /DNA_ORIENTATION=+
MPIPDLYWFFDQKIKILVGVLVAQLGIGVLFSMGSYSASGACYIDPCYWSVSHGLSFQTTLTGFLYILQPLYGLFFLKNRCTQIVGGGFLGSTAVLFIISLVTTVLWGSEAKAAYGFLGSTAAEQASANDILALKLASVTLFNRLCGLSTTYSVLVLLGFCLLCFSREHFCEDDYAVAAARSKIRKADSQFYTYQGVSLLDDDENLGAEDISM